MSWIHSFTREYQKNITWLPILRSWFSHWIWNINNKCTCADDLILPTCVHVHPSKKVTQHDFDRLYFFYPGFLFIKLDISGKPVYMPFDWCLICKDYFTGARAGWVNWGQWQKGKVEKLIGLYGKCMLCQVLGFPFVSVCTRTHCPFIAPNSSETFLFDIAPNLFILHTPQWNNPNKHGINRKANKQAFQKYLTWWIKIQDKRNIIDQNRVDCRIT